jgi:hypothetical protein
VIGRIRHRTHHVHLHIGPPKPAPNLSGCEKHAAGHGALPASPFPALGPVPKLAVAGVGAASLVGIGGLGGLIGGGGGGIISGCPTKTSTKVSTDPLCTHTTPPGGTTTPPGGTTTPPGTSTNVPEPSSIVIFLFAVCIALAARHFLNGHTPRQTA